MQAQSDGIIKAIPCTCKPKRVGVDVKWTLSQKPLQETKKVIHCIIKKGPIHQEDITTVNIDTPNVETPEYIKQKLTDLKVVIDNYTVIVGEFSTPLSTMDRSCRWKISQDTVDMKYTLD